MTSIIIGITFIASGLLPLILLTNFIKDFKQEVDNWGFPVMIYIISIALIAFGIWVIVCGV